MRSCLKCGSGSYEKTSGGIKCLDCGFIGEEVRTTKLEDCEPGVTREQFFNVLKTVTAPIPKTKKAELKETKLDYALKLLKDDSIKAFRDACETKNRQYGMNCEWDVYIETLCERNDLLSIVKMLQHWEKYLEALPRSEAIRGAQSVLHSLCSLCFDIEEMEPDKKE